MSHFIARERQRARLAGSVTSVHFVPEAGDYYALVNVMDDRFFIFFLWNGHYCAIDRKTGTISREWRRGRRVEAVRSACAAETPRSVNF